MENNFNAWNLQDTFDGVPLEDIQPLSQRARSLLARNRNKPLPKTGFVNVIGAIEILAGLEYHYENLIRICDTLAIGYREDETAVYHEAVAYVNRLGQFYHFASSELARKAMAKPTDLIPTICRFKIFRDKHTAHRSIDKPHSSDSADLQIVHARSMSTIGGKLMAPKPASQPLAFPTGDVDQEALRLFRMAMWANYDIEFQIYDANSSSHLNLNIARSHGSIAAEAYRLVETVITHE